MKAIVLTKYGSPENLQIKDVPKPSPKDNEILIKVKAAAVNDYDWSLSTGRPYLYRLLFGLFKPKNAIPGMELAGIVEEVGKNVRAFKPGDEAYGDISQYGFGAMAEYVCVDQLAVVIKPDFISFIEAASISHASMLALQAIRDAGEIKANQKVLINGAGGGVGTFGLQIAKQYNAEVTGVDTGEKLTMMTELGYDQVIDYKKENFTLSGNKYDLIIDAKSSQSPFSYLRSLNTNGKYITVGGQIKRLLQILLLKFFIKKIFSKAFKIVSLKSNEDLDYIHNLYKEGQIKCIIEGPYTLQEAPDAIALFGAGKHKGKVIIVP